MKYIFAILIFLHGAIHMMGFAKAFNYAAIGNIHSTISKPAGLLWLLACVLFLLAGIVFLAKADWWYWLTFIAILLSTILIITVWKDAKFGTIANIILLAGVIIGYGITSYYGWYEEEVSLGLHQKSAFQQSLLSEADLLNLPEPVRNYIRYTGSVGKLKVNNFKIEFTGKIRKNEQSA
jgi:hypothetical protein